MTIPVGKLVTPVGFDATGNLQPLLLSATGEVLISSNSPSLFKPIPKNTITINLTLPAGASFQTGLTVPVGATYRLTTFAVAYVGTVAGVQMFPSIKSGAITMTFLSILAVVSGQSYITTVSILLAAGDIIGVTLVGATLNDDMYISMFCEQVY